MKLRKLIAIILVLSMVLGLSACASEMSDSARLVGEWKGTVDITPYLTGLPNTDVELSGICFDLIFIFEDDGSFEAIVDQYSVRQMVDKLLDVAAKALLETEKGKGMSELDLRLNLESAVNTDEIVASVAESIQSGYYRYRDGIIYLSSENDLKEDPEVRAQEHMEVTLQGDTLTVTKIVGDTQQYSDMPSGVLPLILERQ